MFTGHGRRVVEFYHLGVSERVTAGAMSELFVRAREAKDRVVRGKYEELSRCLLELPGYEAFPAAAFSDPVPFLSLQCFKLAPRGVVFEYGMSATQLDFVLQYQLLMGWNAGFRSCQAVQAKRGVPAVVWRVPGEAAPQQDEGNDDEADDMVE